MQKDLPTTDQLEEMEIVSGEQFRTPTWKNSSSKYKTQEIRNLAASIYRNENPYFMMDDPALIPGVSDKIENMDYKELVAILCGHLLQIAESLETKTRTETIKLQQKMYFQNSKFDKAMIYMLRKMTKNFILLHSDAEIHGLPINMLGIAENGIELD